MSKTLINFTKDARNITITERGWPGHFICGDRCVYHRNTMIECNETNKKIIVSTVGNYRQSHNGDIQTIGSGRYYETMAFEAKQDGPYWDADVSKEYQFDSKWAICADSADQLPKEVDNIADDMHNAVVQEIILTITKE